MRVTPLDLCANNRGSTLIELAFSLMLLLFLAFGTIEYGSMIHERNALTQLARESASLASRNLTTDANILDMVRSSERPLDLASQPEKYRIYLAQVTAGDATNPDPTCTVTERGTLTNGVVAPGAPDCELPPTLLNYLTYDPSIGVAPTQQFTVVKVYYQHDPITPLGNLRWFGGSGTATPTVFFSRAIF